MRETPQSGGLGLEVKVGRLLGIHRSLPDPLQDPLKWSLLMIPWVPHDNNGDQFLGDIFWILWEIWESVLGGSEGLSK